MFPEDHFQLLASADYGDGFVVMLYKTGPEKYCVTERTAWGKTERILTLDREHAVKTYEDFPVKLVGREAAFPPIQD